MSRETLGSPRNQLRRRKELRAKCVTGSRRYRTEEQAQAALERIQASGDPRRLSVPQRVFACPRCAGFHLSQSPAPVVSRTPILPRSKKTAKVYRDVRVPLVVELLTERPWCELRWDEGCTGRSTEVDERCGRGRGGSILDRSNLQTSCSHCHEQKTLHPAEAERRGLAESSADYRARRNAS